MTPCRSTRLTAFEARGNWGMYSDLRKKALRTERIHKLEKVREIHRAAPIQVELRVCPAVRVGEEEEIGEIGPAVAVEIGCGLHRRW